MNNEQTKGKFHEIDRPGQEHDINELFEDLYKRIGVLGVLTTKGDIIVYDGSNAVRLPAGDEGTVLTRRRATTTGLAWEARASAGTGSTGGGDRKYWSFGVPYGAL